MLEEKIFVKKATPSNNDGHLISLFDLSYTCKIVFTENYLTLNFSTTFLLYTGIEKALEVTNNKNIEVRRRLGRDISKWFSTQRISDKIFETK